MSAERTDAALRCLISLKRLRAALCDRDDAQRDLIEFSIAASPFVLSPNEPSAAVADRQALRTMWTMFSDEMELIWSQIRVSSCRSETERRILRLFWGISPALARPFVHKWAATASMAVVRSDKAEDATNDGFLTLCQMRSTLFSVHRSGEIGRSPQSWPSFPSEHVRGPSIHKSTVLSIP